MLCEEKRLGESLTYPQLQDMFVALEEHEENIALSDEIRNIQKDIRLSYKLRKQGFESAGSYLSTVRPLVSSGGSGACKLRRCLGHRRAKEGVFEGVINRKAQHTSPCQSLGYGRRTPDLQNGRAP